MSRERIQRRKRPRTDDTAPESDPDTGDAQATGEKVTDGLDAVLDEIDGVLEQNAQEFVQAYVQKGGE